MPTDTADERVGVLFSFVFPYFGAFRSNDHAEESSQARDQPENIGDTAKIDDCNFT